MNIQFDRPLFGASTKALAVEKGGYDIAEMKRWFRRKEEQEAANNPMYDVNIKVVTANENYEIIQRSVSLREGHHWEVFKDNQFIGDITSARELKTKARVDLKGENLPNLSIEATWRGRGKVTVNGQDSGETKRSGFLVNMKYLIEIENNDVSIDPTLLAGVTYAFWASSE
ncbi:hypothetical protein [Texcoconibacillus texcoconensis]|uniref:Uncharacterized protein n=1 Tax=Texcoconibacillus texcoconensis TaxID=1095777 RepID=A0A840QP39_9BACI|nr:hypothetical protein [Texcoconibacillus texcoconensis]MBB5173152.1 hypothetical protein [Texcoconibacillus texcoconensis]